MRIVFAGTPEAAVPSLRRLIDSPHHDVVAVLTRPDAAAGRRGKPRPSPVAELALEQGIPVLRPVRPNGDEFVAELAGLAPDCCAVVAYGALLRDGLLAVPQIGWINLHFSLLPAWRGAAPVQAAIAAGDAVTGATTFLIELSLDSGPVFGVVTETIRPTDTAGDLLGRLSNSGAALLETTLDG
ncbi:MAG: methionyl-tRNA formyltransferase, partial [Mycobacterium sp.]|nr:methionyl-tRNA formyltransferase [Mycobacterium sp.]